MLAMRFLRRWLATWRFPAVVLPLLFCWEALLAGILWLPAAGPGFADEFRVWCFGYDPATGRVESGYVLTMLTSPLLVAGLVWLVWGRPLRRVLRRCPRAVVPHALLGGALAALPLGLALWPLASRSGAGGELPFPAEELRTALPAPVLDLVDHRGQRLELATLRGRVVLVTAVYARCAFTCPMIFAQSKAALAQLSAREREELSVLGITLDPVHDDTMTLAGLAQAQSIAPPLFRLLTGEPATVERTLDAFGFTRSRDPVTGVIDHANLFVLIDRDGRVAYRFTLGERQQRWLVSALRLLLAEGSAGS
jgi:protein SCO1/2